MSHCTAAGTAAGIAWLLFSAPSAAQSAVPMQLAWQAPANCPQETQVKQKLHDLLGASAVREAPSRLRAEGQIEPIGERFRLTLNIHYDLVNATRVVQASSCEDLSGVAAVTLALLFRAEQNSGAPLTARDLGGAATGAGASADNRSGSDAGNEATRAGNEATRAQHAENASAAAKTASESESESEKPADDEQEPSSEASAGNPSRFRFAFRAPEFRTDIGVLPEPSYGIGLAAGLRQEAWRVLLSGTLWLAQEYESGPFVGYGAHFGRVSGELSGCHGFRFGGFELAPCLLLALDAVSARGTGVGITSTNPRTAFLSAGAGIQGLWSVNRSLAVILGVNARVATSRPRFVSESVGEISQVGPVALGVVLGCEWVL